ncbi:MAG: ATP-binding cassette domain-containing protein, partial [Bacilli bacterium]|nr:ATP-binding cassette domain-containing protein [Bacilli bacterium]
AFNIGNKGDKKMAQLEIRNLTFKYPNTVRAVLDNLSFKIKKGEFVVLTGKTGTGKTTLLNIIKKELTPYGDISGDIYYNGQSFDQIDKQKTVAEIGYVFQNPESQIVTEYVWSELAFGLENLGLSADLIRRRVGETAQFFGINRWFFKKTDQLSGGEKQLVNLAAVIAMQPKLLLLDEPTARLDPLSREEFLMILKKINQELGITILLVEHQLEEVFSICDRIMVLTAGKIVIDAPPRAAGEKIPDNLEVALPSATRFYRAMGNIGHCPLSVKEGQEYLRYHFNNAVSLLPVSLPDEKAPIVYLKDLWFRYGRTEEDVLSGLRFDIKKGEIITILGGNGSGKSTLLKIIAGVYQPYRGKVHAKKNRIALLPQNPEDLFLGPTVIDDLMMTFNMIGIKDYAKTIVNWAKELGVHSFLNRNFYDLSGGERQKAGLLKVLITNADVILLDEPTKGLDEKEKKEMIAILKRLQDKGITVVIVTHDIEFAAVASNRCALLFAGEIIAAGEPHNFFSGNCFYTTAAARISRDYYNNAVTVEDLVYLATENGVK